MSGVGGFPVLSTLPRKQTKRMKRRHSRSTPTTTKKETRKSSPKRGLVEGGMKKGLVDAARPSRRRIRTIQITRNMQMFQSASLIKEGENTPMKQGKLFS
jgi:hypothetical protein